MIFLWFLAVLNEDGAIVFGDIRPDRGSSDNWILQGRTSTILPLVRILIIKYYVFYIINCKKKLQYSIKDCSLFSYVVQDKIFRHF